MNFSNEDTIVALSTPPGEGGISIVRLSGTRALSVAEQVFVPARSHAPLRNRMIHYGHIADPRNSRVIDEVLLLVMKGPRSYTCQDMVEIQCHGGMVPSGMIVELLLALGARMAQPGEFTCRAFINGRIDILQAEAVLALIQSKTDRAMEYALQQLEGRVSEKLEGFRRSIVDIVAALEASVDFPDEEVPLPSEDMIRERVSSLVSALSSIIESSKIGQIYREGLKVALVGKPNTGKSSLLNTLLGEKRAIVTEHPGTTRDSVQEWCNIKGIPMLLIDTAGIRETDDPVESEGVRRTLDCIERADVILPVFDLSGPPEEEDHRIMVHVSKSGKKWLALFNKADEERKGSLGEFLDVTGPGSWLRVSALCGTGVESLIESLSEMVMKGGGAECILAGTLRQKEKLIRIRESLVMALESLGTGMPSDLSLIDLRKAMDYLGELLGERYDEEILDTLFSQFCIGK